MVGSAAVGGAQPGFAFLISAVTANFFIQGQSLKVEETGMHAGCWMAGFGPGHVLGLTLVPATHMRADEVTLPFIVLSS